MVIFLIIFSVAVIPLHFIDGPEWVGTPLFLFDRTVVTIFTAEYVLRIWAAKKPFRYVFSWWGIIDLIAILPFYLAKLALFGSSQAFLALRILRLLKLGRVYDMERVAILSCSKNSHGEFKVIPGEEIERVVQKHPLVLLISLSLPLAFTSTGLFTLVFSQSVFAIAVSILFFCLAIIFFINAWLNYNYDVIYITNRRIIVQNRHLFGSTANDISYEAITNVVPSNTGIIHWLFKFGNIRLETASSAGIVNFNDTPKPHSVVQHISANRELVLRAKIKTVASS